MTFLRAKILARDASREYHSIMKRKPLTVAQRQSARRKRMKERGYQIVRVWVRNEDAGKVVAFAAQLMLLPDEQSPEIAA